MIHPRVKTYLLESEEKDWLKSQLKKLAEDPYLKRAEVDIKKLKGKKHDMYRLRVGNHRFEYFVDEEKIWIDQAFKRKRGYR